MNHNFSAYISLYVLILLMEILSINVIKRTPITL